MHEPALRDPNVTPTPDRVQSRVARTFERGAIVAVPFGLIVYLAFSGGGFDSIIRDRVGIAVWWVILLATMLGALRFDRLPIRAKIVIAALAGFAAWSGLSMLWSESADRSANELARVTTYLGIFLLTLALSRRGRLRETVAAVAAAIGFVAGVSLLSRLQPQLFPDSETVRFIAAAQSRLNYPLDYWNGLGTFVAMGTPLLIHFATNARHAAARFVSTALLPVLGLVLYLTLSRGGEVALAVGVVTLIALHPGRLALLPQVAIGGVATAVLVWAAEARPAFVDGLTNDAGRSAGDTMALIVLVVCALAGVARFGVSALAAGRRAPELPGLSGRGKAALAAGIAVVALAAVLAFSVPSRVSDGWEQFKDPDIAHNADRLGSASGNGRYQWWSSAIDAYSTEPVLGIGAGTFQFWWARNGSIPGQVADAHSLYFETLGELGIVGFVLIMVVVAGGLLMMVRVTIAAPRKRRRDAASAIAGAAAFATAAALDWAWELSVLPVAFLILLAAVLGRDEAAGEEAPASNGVRTRVAVAVLSVVAVAVTVPPLLGATAIRDSQAKFRSGDLDGALSDADRANDFEPYSGAAALQRALVLEGMDRLDPAAEAAREATREEATNWQSWFALARIERKLGLRDEAAADLDQARDLNPTAPVFDRGPGQSEPG